MSFEVTYFNITNWDDNGVAGTQPSHNIESDSQCH